MCLIVVFDANKTAIHESWLRDWHASNPDGFGFVVQSRKTPQLQDVFPKKPRYTKRKVGNIKAKYTGNVAEGYELLEGVRVDPFGQGRNRGFVLRGLGSEDQFVKTFRQVEKCARDRTGKSWVVVHLRMRTHGLVDIDNTHPYMVSDGLFLCHNGILTQGNAKDRTKSDTWHYVRDVMAPLVERYGGSILMDPVIGKFITEDIGGTNKMALYGEAMAEPVLFNKRAGVVFDDAWFSNTYAWTAGARHGGKLAEQLVPPKVTSKSVSGWNGSTYDYRGSNQRGLGPYAGLRSEADSWRWDNKSPSRVKSSDADSLPGFWSEYEIAVWSTEDRVLTKGYVHGDEPTRRGLYTMFHDFKRLDVFYSLSLAEREVFIEGGADAFYELYCALDENKLTAEIKELAAEWLADTAEELELVFEDDEDADDETGKALARPVDPETGELFEEGNNVVPINKTIEAA